MLGKRGKLLFWRRFVGSGGSLELLCYVRPSRHCGTPWLIAGDSLVSLNLRKECLLPAHTTGSLHLPRRRLALQGTLTLSAAAGQFLRLRTLRAVTPTRASVVTEASCVPVSCQTNPFNCIQTRLSSLLDTLDLGSAQLGLHLQLALESQILNS